MYRGRGGKCHKLIEYAQASPGIECGIGLLGCGQRACLPVGEPLGFADASAEKDGVYLLETGIADAVCRTEPLQLDESCRFDRFAPSDHRHVIAQAQSH